MTRQGSKRFDPDELKKLLQSCLLTTGRGQMAPVVDGIVRSYSLGTPLRLSFHGPSDEQVVEVVKALDIDVDLDSNADFNRLEVPSEANRFEDFELLIPFHLHRLNEQFLERGSNARIKKVEGVSLLLLLTLVKQGQDKLGTLIEQMGPAAAEHDGTIRAVLNLSGKDVEIGFQFYQELRRLPPVAAWYLGLVPGDPLDVKEPQYWIDDLAFEVSWREIRDVDALDVLKSWGAGKVHEPELTGRYPLVKKLTEFKVEDVGLAARNLMFLNLYPDDWLSRDDNKMVHDCLKMRLEGLKEPKIAEELGFKKLDAFRKFLSENRIGIKRSKYDVDIRSPRKIVEQWEETRVKLRHTEELRQQQKSAKQRGETCQPKKILVSGDCRSATYQGSRFHLTPSQGASIKILADNFPNSVSYAHIMAEVSNDFDLKTETFRKLFRGNETAFNSLVEKIDDKRAAKYRLVAEPDFPDYLSE